MSIFLKFPKVYFSDAQSVFLEPLLFSTAPLPGGRPILSGIGLDPTLRLSWTRRQSAAACRCNPSDQISNSILGQHQVPGRPSQHRHTGDQVSGDQNPGEVVIHLGSNLREQVFEHPPPLQTGARRKEWRVVLQVKMDRVKPKTFEKHQVPIVQMITDQVLHRYRVFFSLVPP